MMGMEGCIEKIDRHKRIARIRVEMFGRTIEATVGLEIVEKV
jgi:transcriptional antiterminator NusG